MVVKWMVWGVLLASVLGEIVAEDEDDFEIDFDFSEYDSKKLVDAHGLPPWFSKIKSILNQDLEPRKCSGRKIHARYGGHGYFFSWEDARSAELELSWNEARDFCRERCMEVVSIESKRENMFITDRITRGTKKYAWTSGRKCNFYGCDRPDLQPHNIYGWFWSGSLQRLPPTTNRIDTEWSDTGGIGKPQPDNRENLEGGVSEDCLAILNNFYNDGVKWHDVGCHHRKPFICEDSEKMLEDVDYYQEGAQFSPPVRSPIEKPSIPTEDIKNENYKPEDGKITHKLEQDIEKSKEPTMIKNGTKEEDKKEVEVKKENEKMKDEKEELEKDKKDETEEEKKEVVEKDKKDETEEEKKEELEKDKKDETEEEKKEELEKDKKEMEDKKEKEEVKVVLEKKEADTNKKEMFKDTAR